MVRTWCITAKRSFVALVKSSFGAVDILLNTGEIPADATVPGLEGTCEKLCIKRMSVKLNLSPIITI